MSLPLQPTRLELADADIRYWPQFWDGSTAAGWLEELRDELTWEQHSIRMFGKTLASPRLSAWHGSPGACYRYSGIALEPRPWTPRLLEVKADVERALGEAFDSTLANLYRDGQDSMGWHSDDEPELGPTPLIASVSFGATRRFRLQHRNNRSLSAALDLEPGSLLVMAGSTQRYWRHSVPKTRRPIGPRLNLTFRQILEER